MAVHIIVDGYNLIRQSRVLSGFEMLSLEEGRAALLDDLSGYKKLTGHYVTVVFDAAERKGPGTPAGMERGIKVMYSALGQTADEVILRLVEKEKLRAVVVTSDTALAKTCESLGATCISSAEFEERLILAFAEKAGSEADEDEEPSRGDMTLKKGPSRRLSRKARKKKGKLSKL